MMNDNNAYRSFYNLVNSRYSCRAYDTARPVPRDIMLEVLDAARLAPSACNRQPWTFLVADTHELCELAASSYEREWARTAPAFIIACGRHEDAWHRSIDGKDHTDVDLSIAVEHICLAAASLGLGSCWICNFDPEVIVRGFNLPEGVEPVAMVAIGYPAENSKPVEKRRKPLDEIVKWGKY